MYKMIKKNKCGYTLVELIVSFTLLLILMTAALATISPAIKVYARVSAMARAQNVSDMLMEKMDDELGNALEINSSDGVTNGRLEYTDRNGNAAYLQLYSGEDASSGDGKIHIQYVTVDGPNIIYGTDWYFPPSSYMNNDIESLDFNYDKIMEQIQVTLTLKNTETGATYTRTKMIKLHNLDE